MGAAFLVVCLAGLLYLVVRLGVATVKADLAPDAPAPRPDDPGCPRPALFFLEPATPLVVDGHLCRSDGVFAGVVAMAPGEHQVSTPSHTVRCTLADDSLQVIDFSSGEPEVLDPTVGRLMVRALLERVGSDALITAEELAASPTPADALHASESIDPRIFGESDLEALERAYDAWRDGGDPAAWLASLRLHEVPARDMGRQAAHFSRWAGHLLAQLQASPPLAGPARKELAALAADLVATGDRDLAAHGKAIAALLAGLS